MLPFSGGAITLLLLYDIFHQGAWLFCVDSNYILSSEVLLLVDSYTYISEAWNGSVTADARAWLEGMSASYGAATADHIPVAMTINVGHFADSNASTIIQDWSILTKEDISAYDVDTHKLSSDIYIYLGMHAHQM